MIDFEKNIKSLATLPVDFSKLKNKTVLISGGTGFIGSLLIKVLRYRSEHFSDNIKVISISRRQLQSDDTVRYISGDISKELPEIEKADYILHLASNTHPKQYSTDPVGTINANVFGCCNLLNLAVKVKAERFLLASSVEIYGNGSETPMDENYCGYLNCFETRASYNEAKRLSESMCKAYNAQYGVDVVAVRLARCFGKDETKADSKALAQFMNKAVSGEDIVLKSKGLQRFSYCYVVDAVNGILTALLNGKCGEVYNVTEDDEGRTLGDYAKLIANLAGKDVVYEFTGEAGASKADFALLDNSKIKAIGFKPLFTVEEGIKETYSLYKE